MPLSAVSSWFFLPSSDFTLIPLAQECSGQNSTVPHVPQSVLAGGSISEVEDALLQGVVLHLLLSTESSLQGLPPQVLLRILSPPPQSFEQDDQVPHTGHPLVLHGLLDLREGQGFPPCFGFVTTFLVLNCSPPPQDLEQEFQFDQEDT